ncbi:hypothetical protein HPP92_013015 [Vanilla planifolia]|uniref:Uncharacterized protein n=1 Tax=Vanilla planifolia TaxID=51239 RepID=A0A835QRK7_VANPL|nr:hypothetical protein HPP92_013015 [Vanilla planifolia]
MPPTYLSLTFSAQMFKVKWRCEHNLQRLQVTRSGLSHRFEKRLDHASSVRVHSGPTMEEQTTRSPLWKIRTATVQMGGSGTLVMVDLGRLIEGLLLAVSAIQRWLACIQ